MVVAYWPLQRIATLGDHPLSVAETTMARGAIDIESILAAVYQNSIYLDTSRETIKPLTIHGAYKISVVFLKMPSSDRSRYKWPVSSAIGVKCALVEWLLLRLSPHIGVAAAEGEHAKAEDRKLVS